jgi:tetratricopeptide (TPR) repeat protein
MLRNMQEIKVATWRTSHLRSIAARLHGDATAALVFARTAATEIAGPRADIDRMRSSPNFGLALVDAGNYDEAMSVLGTAGTLFKRYQTKASPEMADVWLGLGRALLGLNRPAEALLLLQQADSFWRNFEADKRWAGEAAFWLARANEALGRKADAKRDFTRAIDLLTNSPIAQDRKLIDMARRH